jgi:cell division septal protein FtsQ
VRVFPSTVKIYIEERDIIGAIFYENTFVFVDNEQVVLEVNQKLSNTTIPIITIKEDAVGTIVVGDQLQINPEWVKKEVFDILNILQQEKLLGYISEINITEDNLFYLYTKKGSLIKVKNSDTVNEKLDFISTYLVKKDERMIVDLTHGGNPTYIPR